jgi:hypothetical protein
MTSLPHRGAASLCLLNPWTTVKAWTSWDLSKLDGFMFLSSQLIMSLSRVNRNGMLAASLDCVSEGIGTGDRREEMQKREGINSLDIQGGPQGRRIQTPQSLF